jgi:hypothetical protein
MSDLIFPAILVSAFVAWIVLGIRYQLRKPPSEFAAGVARSMVSDPTAWDYHSDENWLVSQKAMLEISLQAGNFGRVNTRQHVNCGSSQIVTFFGADRRAFCKALTTWRELTAIERQHTAERRKREALAILKAA